MAFDTEGNIYVSDTLNHRVQKLTSDGKFLMKWGHMGDAQGDFNMPWGITVDELGDVYVADWKNHRVQKFNADGDFLFEFGEFGSEDGQFNHPSGVCVDAHGDIYVADWGNHRVQLFNSDGMFVEKFTGDATLSKQAHNYMITNLKALRLREMTPIEPQKRLRWPVSVRVDDKGRMYAGDYGSNRIQIYQKEAIPLGPDEIAPEMRSPSLYTQF
jgi:DNA-binding beta-propeller fold protein YncE